MSWSTPPVFTVGQVLTAAQQNILSGDLNFLFSGNALAYTEFTSNVSITATTEGTANTIVTAGAVTFDGATACMVEFFCAQLLSGTTTISLYLYDGAASIGQIGGQDTASTGAPIRASRKLTPSAAAHTYSIRGGVDAGTGTATAGAGGVGAFMPGYIHVHGA